MATIIQTFYGNGFYGPLIVRYSTLGNDGDCTYKLVIHHGDSIEGPVVETFDNHRSGSSVYFSSEAIRRLYSYTRNEKLTNLCAAIETWKDGTKISTTRGLVTTFMWDNAHPIITASVVDINEKTVGLTGDSEILVRYCSNAKATMTAEAQKGAAIDENLYIIRNGNDSGYGTTHTFENVEDNEFIFSAEDSRGCVGQKTLKPKMVDYIKPTCNIANNRPDALGNMTVVCNGQYFNDSFGAVDNTLTVKCQYYEAGTTPTDNWIEMTVTITGNSYIAYADFVISNFDQQKYYVFEALASDKIYNMSSNTSIVKSTPIFHWGENDFVFEVPVTFMKGFENEEGEENSNTENGTWIPYLNSNAISSYITQFGCYSRVANVVTLGFHIKANCNSGYQNTNIEISNLPFSPLLPTAGGGMCSGAYISGGYTFQCFVAEMNGTITIRVQACNNTSAANLSTSASGCNYRNSGGEITLSGTITFMATT